MDMRIDWSLMEVFLAVAETGSLSAAARQLGSSQPTVGRQVREIEARLGAELFHRRPRGLEVTEMGAALIAPARAMRDAMGQVALSVAGAETQLAGAVRITAPHLVSHYILPGIIAQMRAEEPEIQIDLLPSDSTENLLFREADIAVRMYRSDQLDIITRKLGDVPMGIFAARTYLARAGRPERPGDLAAHQLVGYDRSDLILQGMRAAGLPAERNWFGTRCDAQATNWELVRQGCGIGFGQLKVGMADPLLERLLPEFEIPGIPMWLAAAEAMRNTPRIRRAWDMLAAGLAPFVS